MRSKEAFTFVASGPLSAGINVALVGYTLAPEISIDEMVAEIRRALDWLVSGLAWQLVQVTLSKFLSVGLVGGRAPRRRCYGPSISTRMCCHQRRLRS